MASVYVVIRNDGDEALVTVKTFSTKAKAKKYIKDSIKQDKKYLLSIPIDENEIRMDIGDNGSVISTYDTTIIYQLEKTEIE